MGWIMASSDLRDKMKLYSSCRNVENGLKRRDGLVTANGNAIVGGMICFHSAGLMIRMLSVSLDVLEMAEIMTRVTDTLHQGKLFSPRRHN